MQENFTYLNDYYDKIYVLSVASAEERREQFAQLFEGLDYTFFFGANKNAFTVEDTIRKNIFSESLTREHHRFSKTMKAGEIACSWSHKMMYEDMLTNNYERILIFEDDAVPDKKQLALIPAILKEIPADTELLMWGWAKNGSQNAKGRFKQWFYHLQRRYGKLKWDDTMIDNLYAKPFSKHLKIAGFHDYTYAYAVNRSAAEKLISLQTPLQYIADNLLAHASTRGILKAFITYPAVFLHDSLPDGTHRDSYIR